MLGNARIKPCSRNEAQKGNTNCTPSIGNAPPLRRQNVHRSTEIRPSRTEYKPLPRKHVESTDRPAEMYSVRAHQHGARNCNRSQEHARKVQTVEQKVMIMACACEPRMRNPKSWSSHCAYRNLSCCMIVAAARDDI